MPIARRCFMPSEYFFTLRDSLSPNPVISKTSSYFSLETPRSLRIKSRFSFPVNPV